MHHSTPVANAPQLLSGEKVPCPQVKVKIVFSGPEKTAQKTGHSSKTTLESFGPIPQVDAYLPVRSRAWPTARVLRLLRRAAHEALVTFGGGTLLDLSDLRGTARNAPRPKCAELSNLRCRYEQAVAVRPPSASDVGAVEHDPVKLGLNPARTRPYSDLPPARSPLCL